MTELPDVIVFDHLPSEVRDLIEVTSIAGTVQFVDRSSMIGAAGIVTEIHPIIPPVAWSSGEQVLWAFVASLAGQGEVNLHQLINYYRRELAEILVAISSVAVRLHA
jgi:hypothetical protein